MTHLPLAAQLRPTTLADYVGQKHLIGEGRPLYHCFKQRKCHSMLLWGPPGTGKTTLAKMLANNSDCEFIAISAVLAGVNDIRQAIKTAKNNLLENKRTILFIDEIHRFNKAQQDALLPHVEEGTLYFIGATTENPSFEVNFALLSRCRVYALKPLTHAELEIIFANAFKLSEALRPYVSKVDEKAKKALIQASDGDARRLLTFLEVLLDKLVTLKPDQMLTTDMVGHILQQGYRRFDKQGDIFYEQISALHKAVRGSNPDAALYWLCRMIDGGCDLAYLGRRIVRMASEDIGNADPRALTLALDACSSFERLGQPEGELALAQAIVYLACAPKSNAVYCAFNAAKETVKNNPSYGVPLHLRNAPTQLMKQMQYGKQYRYDHDEPNGFACGQTYFPAEMGEQFFYEPVNRGLEIQIREKLKRLRQENQTQEN